MRHAALCLALAACGPRIEVVDTTRDDALVHSTRPDARPVRDACPEGYVPIFPGENYYALPPGQDLVALRATATDPDGVRRLAVVIPAYAGRPAGRPDLDPVAIDIPGEGGPVPSYVLEDPDATAGSPRRADLAFVLRPSTTSLAYFMVVARDDPRNFWRIRREFVSVRLFRTVCQANPE